MKKHSRFKVARNLLVFWCLFIGIGAVWGAACMLIKPDGSMLQMQSMLPYFQVLPFADVLFQNYIFPGISLLIVNGLTNLTAVGLMFAKRKLGVTLGFCFGITLMLWICIQFAVFPPNPLSTSYFFFGLLQMITGYAALVFYGQEHFTVNESDYKNIGTNPKELVVYFSRMGYVKKLAFEAAEKSGARLYEVRAAERTEGTLGFWWCGRYGMHRWAMPIEDIGVDLTEFDKVTVCSSIWVFDIAAPMRSFCEKSAGKIKRADYILAHHMGSRFENVAAEMDKLLGVKHEKLISVKTSVGKFKEV